MYGLFALSGALEGAYRRSPRSGAARQLVVFLHGYGADGNDLIEIGKAWQNLLPHAAFVSPNAPHPCGQAPMGRDGMVASCHPLASVAGVEVLKSGGNVVDAAIATNAVLGVTQPNFCGVGGDWFCLYYEAETRRVHFLNGRPCDHTP